ncbi:hypothetical protein C2S51_033220 [Perilla frutescens var. frutescens]|nr:hypothetical protein C2S51_033220 [Perilla frutescens var. frutescens]
MPTAVTDNASTTEQIVRNRKPRNPELDPNSNRSKTTISSILLSSSPTTNAVAKKKNFSSATFRGLGCAASSQVSVPAVIRTSANWEAKKLKKKRLNTKKSGNAQLLINGNTPAAAATAASAAANPLPQSSSLSLALSSSCVGAPDVWCGAGIGLSTDATSVDCVVSRRPSRGKVDVIDRITALAPRERSYNVRRMVTPEDNPFLESDNSLGIARIRSDVPGSRHHRHVRHGFREGLAEIVMLQSSLLMGGRSDGLDRYRDLRLDIDSMSYEELLELSDRIGYVSTGLKDDEITHCLGRTKLAVSTDLSLHFASEMERKCSICQEEYEADDETGKLNCGHFYHIYCIKQWLGQKNSCPICKTSVMSQTEAK